MNKTLTFLCLFIITGATAQQSLFIPQNVKKAFTNETRSMDGKPGKNTGKILAAIISMLAPCHQIEA